MKTLKTSLYLLVILTVFATSCKKDNSDNPGASGNNKYTYQGKDEKIASSNYTVIDVAGANTLSLVLEGTETSQWLQLFFYKAGETIPEGNFTFKQNYEPTYNPATNFAGGNVNLGIADAHEITGGTITVAKDGDNYKITVDATTSRGPVKGSYTGSISRE
jgi:hypothetical protein